MTFDDVIPKILASEGGYVNDPDDPGKETKFGISSKAYPDENIKELTIERAKELYYSDYWIRGKVGGLPKELRYLHMDSCVNHGFSRASKMLQEAIGTVDVDGYIGPKTLEAARADHLWRYGYVRLAFYVDLVVSKPVLGKFLKGWAARIDRVMNNV